MINEIETYLRSYLSFSDNRYHLPLSLFALLEHCWEECFDEVPYLSITSVVPGTAKTRVAEILKSLAPEGKATLESAITLAALYTEIEERKTVMLDEAEFLYNPRTEFRPVVNGGYRRGQYVTRKIGGTNVKFNIFCPKVFCTIGDVFESLRERCILVTMTKIREDGNRKEWDKATVEAEGSEIAQRISDAIRGKIEHIKDAYHQYHQKDPKLSFLPDDREVEIWKPLFALCQVFAPSRIPELIRSAVDISALKTMPIRSHTDLADEKRRAQELQYAEKLLCDAIAVMKGHEKMASSELIQRLRALDTSPWRSYRGTGISDDAAGFMLLASLLSRFGVGPKPIRVKPKSEPNSTVRGYTRQDLMAGAERAGVSIPGLKGRNPVTPSNEIPLAVPTGPDDKELQAASAASTFG
jgi:hypothetical protein